MWSVGALLWLMMVGVAADDCRGAGLGSELGIYSTSFSKIVGSVGMERLMRQNWTASVLPKP